MIYVGVTEHPFEFKLSLLDISLRLGSGLILELIGITFLISISELFEQHHVAFILGVE